MTEHQLSLAPFYAGWDVYQQHLVAAIAPLTAEQLALRSSPQNWSVGMIATHIIAVRVGWFHMWMGAGDAELAALGEWDEEPWLTGHTPISRKPSSIPIQAGKIGPGDRASGLSGMYLNTTSTTAANSPPSSARTDSRRSI